MSAPTPTATANTNETDKFTNLTDLLKEVMVEHDENEKNGTKTNTLIAVLRKKHYWPYLQVKQYFDRSGLTLLHNTYKRDDVSHFAELYNECRSVVLDLDAPIGKNIVVSLAGTTPTIMHDIAYKLHAQPADVCEQSYEGTVVFVYYHVDKWHFSTTSCPSVNSSRYRHPTKTHGCLMNEVINKHYPADTHEESRAMFTATLDTNKAYSFILVHHENQHITDHTDEFGADYGALVHIGTRLRKEDVPLDLQDAKNQINLPFIKYARRFASPDEAMNWLSSREPKHTYGFVVKRKTEDGKENMLRVCPTSILEKDEEDLGNTNMWMNMLHVYKQNLLHFRVEDYLTKYHPDWKETNPGNHGYVIHTAFKTFNDILYDLYRRTTYYNKTTQRYTMDKTLDASLAPMIRFHLAQLRFIQTSTHLFGPLTYKAVYHYMCFHVTMKNIRMLIRFFASESLVEYPIHPAALKCIITLNQELSKR